MMYGPTLAATGLAGAVLWLPLAAFAFIALGVALWHAAGTLRSDV
jgi:hypothetical protein